ncbi:hypothetical protein [Microbacterium sp. NPDC087592]|uniref:hypothetical protein n=1 Tax=Microbacterium sp. NPDC087592 TaxID=3364193 RepID=UPI0037F19794
MSARGGWIPWAAGIALVLAAGVVTAVTPPEDALTDPFFTRAAVDDTATSRTLIAAVQGASFADRLTVADKWEADGNWLVIELAVSAPTTEEDAVIGVASLVIDGQVFLASERPPTSLLRAKLRVGTDTIGTLAFELPEGLRTGNGELRLTGEYPTPRLDDVITFPLSLDEVPQDTDRELDEPRLGAP